MVIPYYEELESTLIRYELANLSEENKKKGVSSTILSAKPAFILPNNNLYYTTMNHYDANFYRDVIHCFEVIETSKIREKVELYITQAITIFAIIEECDYQLYRFFDLLSL